MPGQRTFGTNGIPFLVRIKEEVILAGLGRGDVAGRTDKVSKSDIVSSYAGTTGRLAVGASFLSVTCC